MILIKETLSVSVNVKYTINPNSQYLLLLFVLMNVEEKEMKNFLEIRVQGKELK